MGKEGRQGAILRLHGASATALHSSPTAHFVNPEHAYEEMIRLSREETLLASCLELLEWDEEVCMPRRAVQHRSEQRALLAGMVHDRETDPRYEELLGAVEGSPPVRAPEGAGAVNVRGIR